MKPLVSVIIPCYNVEKYINKCIDSVLSQTLKDIEVIAIDDGSNDSTYEILKSYKDSRLKVETQENMGQAKTRNKAIKKAKGEYLFFLDSDDYIDNDLLEKLYVKTIDGYDIVTCDGKKVYEDNDSIDDLNNYKEYTDNDIKNYILNNFGPCFKLVKKSIIVDNELYFYEGHIYEDIAVTPAWGIYANKIIHVPNTFYYYLIRKGSTMNQVIYNKKLEDIFYSLEHLSVCFDGKYKDELEYIYIENLLHAASLRFFKFKKYDQLDMVVNVIKNSYPKWNKNMYYKNESIKYKIVCNLFYKKNYTLLKLILK